MVIAKQAGGVERVRLRLPAAPVVSIEALPAAPLHLIELPEQMKPAARSSSFKKMLFAGELGGSCQPTPTGMISYTNSSKNMPLLTSRRPLFFLLRKLK